MNHRTNDTNTLSSNSTPTKLKPRSSTSSTFSISTPPKQSTPTRHITKSLTQSKLNLSGNSTPTRPKSSNSTPTRLFTGTNKLPCGFSADDDEHYSHHLSHTLMTLISDPNSETNMDLFSDHCHLDGRSHDLSMGYCGIYEREVDLRLESAFDTMDLDECDSCDELEYDLESLEQYSPDYDRSINPWSSFAMVDIESTGSAENIDSATTDEFGFDFDSLSGSNSTLNDSDIVNDNFVAANQNRLNDNLTNPGTPPTNEITNSLLTNESHDRNDNVERLLPSSICAIQLMKMDNAAALATANNKLIS